VIIKGGSRGEGAALGNYLQHKEADERATVLEVKGTVAKHIVGALKEMEAYADGTKCEKPLYHAIISPQPDHPLSRAQLIESVDLLEKELGLQGQPRIIVAHEKDGREHYHIAWARIDLLTMKAIPDSHNYRKHEEVARELERRFDHPRVQGAHAERDGPDGARVERPDRSPSRAELRQEERTGIKGKDVKAQVTALFRASDNAEAFKTALEDAGYILARGDRRDFVLVDRAGGDHSLARRIVGMKAAPLRDFMASLDRNSLPSVEEAKVLVRDRLSGYSDFDQQCWQDTLAANAIEAVRDSRKQDALDKTTNADAIAWEDALADHAIARARREDELLWEWRRQRAQDRKENRLEKSYAQGADYVTQSQAATKHHKQRQKSIDNHAPRPRQPGEPAGDDERLEELLRDHDRDRRRAEQAGSALSGGAKDPIAAALGSVEMTEGLQQRMDRMQGDAGGQSPVNRDDWAPDKQREAPGGGRTRSR